MPCTNMRALTRVYRRTIQMDIQFMRSEKLGYNAPIVVRDHKYYEYEDPDYSITDTPLSAPINKMSLLDILEGTFHIYGYTG